MGAMAWTTSMSVGFREFDDDHKVLIGVINKLASAGMDEVPAEVVQQSLSTLNRYARFHFEREERVMRACG